MYRIVFAGLICLTLMFAFTAYAGGTEFSADVIMTAEGHTMNGKIYAGKDRFRIEFSKPEKMVAITRVDRQVVWNIMPDQQMYMEMPFDPANSPKAELQGEIERKLVGSETIDGHPAKKYLVTYKEGKTTARAYQWMATDIDFPVKVSDVNNKWVQEYRNIKKGPQAESLFEVPQGFKKMEVPMVPRGMGKGKTKTQGK